MIIIYFDNCVNSEIVHVVISHNWIVLSWYNRFAAQVEQNYCSSLIWIKDRNQLDKNDIPSYDTPPSNRTNIGRVRLTMQLFVRKATEHDFRSPKFLASSRYYIHPQQKIYSSVYLSVPATRTQIDYSFPLSLLVTFNESISQLESLIAGPGICN